MLIPEAEDQSSICSNLPAICDDYYRKIRQGFVRDLIASLKSGRKIANYLKQLALDQKDTQMKSEFRALKV